VADEPISQLTQISPPPFVTAFTNPSSGAMLEILDTTNHSMASSGTNSKIAPGDLLQGYLAAGTNVTLTETSGVVTIAASGGGLAVGNPVTGGSNNATLVEDGSGNLAALALGTAGQVLTSVSGAPAWANPITETVITNHLSSQYNCTATLAATGLTVALPAAGTYLLMANVRASVQGTSSGLTQCVWLSAELYDTIYPRVVPNSLGLLIFLQPEVISVASIMQSCAPVGPVVYTVTGATTIALYAAYTNSGIGSPAGNIPSDANGYTTLTAIRLY
jgi:hypothetical protein